MPARKSTQKNKKRRPPKTDSPIKVGGGGGRRVRGRLISYLEIYFAHDKYIADSQDTKNHVNPKLVLDYIDVNGQTRRVNANTKVEIKYKKNGTFGTDKINLNTGKMGVRFEQDQLPYDYDLGKHYGEDLEFRTLKIDGQPVPIDTSGVWSVEAHTELKPTRKKKAR